MKKDNSTTTSRELLVRSVFFLLLFSYPFLSLLWRRTYPVFSQESLWIFSGIVAASILFGFLSTRVRPIVSYLLTATLILICFMIQFDLLLEGILVCIAVIGALMFVFKQRFHINGLLILIAVMVGAYFDSSHQPYPDKTEQNASKINLDLPPVVHILLDGFIGIGGLPDIPATNIIRKEILSFFESNDFLLFSHAYSRYAITGDSLYTALNFRHDSENSFVIETGAGIKHVMAQNAVFAAIEALDYRLNIYQTNHIDLCQSNPKYIDRCWQYDSPNVHYAADSENVRLKVRVLVKTLLRQSKFLWKTLPKYLQYVLGPIPVHDPRVFQLVDQDISKRGPGNYFFAHALIPHSPFMYQADCSVRYGVPRQLMEPFHRDEAVLPDQIYDYRNGLYFGQMECALNSVRLVIESLKRQGLYEQAIVIVHGDHGSYISPRRPRAENQELMSGLDYRSAYSTLFAVKYPGSKFSVNARALALPYLLEEFMTALPSYVQPQKHYPVFEPSENADKDKTDMYFYLMGTYPRVPVYVDIFEE